ncbi:MAG: phosphoenolpyruvate carboxylase [Proteobacteria bacterium]|nr:MAG: phosphoenolpyruvate carboxylase [Pseudomonadota bacterium]
MTTLSEMDTFHRTVINKFQIYNSLFLNLPFDQVHQVGVLLPLLNQHCQKGYHKQQSPKQIIEDFFDHHVPGQTGEQRIAVLFKLIQYIERQIVLFDAIEEAAFTDNHALDGPGSVPMLAQRSTFLHKTAELKEKLKRYHARIVLTAHPTQFYPGPVLGIITELSQAIKDNNLGDIEMLLQQLGKTPLYSKQKPTPFEEAVSLTWYLENVLYKAVQDINKRLENNLYSDGELPGNAFIEVGFWPGGDRDGNPFVTAETTVKVARRLRSSILKCYYRHVRHLKRRLTFKNIEDQISRIEQQLYIGGFTNPEQYDYSAEQLLTDLKCIKTDLINDHQSLFVDQVDALIRQVHSFGFHFAALDIRQDSRVLTAVHAVLNNTRENSDDLPVKDTLASMQAMHQIQQSNGKPGCQRYIISNCQSVAHVKTVMNLMHQADLPKPLPVDIVPLFETIEDLRTAPNIMATLYQDSEYSAHLSNRNKQQTIMLGFSDGTKDGGYIAANWAILKAKEALSEVAEEHNIKVIFFDGRGGPPARGGGETHQFYASLSPHIQNHATQLTIQGQTISSNFGNPDTAQYNLEQLLSAGVFNAINPPTEAWHDDAYSLLQQLADISFDYYQAFKKHPDFVPYLEQISTLKYYGQTNISSRPTKRGDDKAGLVFEDLRAIPFVGAWSQLKQNVLGYYGVGTALQQLIDDNRLADLQQLYTNSGFFKTLMDNCMMSLAKSYMPLTAYLEQDPRFGDFWRLIKDEFERSRECLLAVSQQTELLANQKRRNASIQIRENIVLPLLTIQQYALQTIEQLKKQNADPKVIQTHENMVTRSLYGNINASRNAV